MGVSVLDTEDEVTAMLTGKEVIIQCSTYSADVKSTGRAWRKAHSYFSFHVYLLVDFTAHS